MHLLNNTFGSRKLINFDKRSDRQKQQDEIRSAVKEINSLKAELFEIKSLIKEVIKK